MVSAYAKKQDGLKVSWACLFTGLEMRKNMGQVKKTLKWIRKKSVFLPQINHEGEIGGKLFWARVSSSILGKIKWLWPVYTFQDFNFMWRDVLS